MTDWQPIETAPKVDDAPILTYSPEGGFYGGDCYNVAYWVNFANCWCTWPDAEYSISPTHWMSCPNPPITKEQK